MSESKKKNVKFPLKLTENKAKTKTLFAEVDSYFADVLLSFLTLPLGTIVRIMQKHFKDEAPPFGSLTTLYEGLSNLDNSKFWTEGAKSILLQPRSSFDAQRKMLKLDIGDSPPTGLSSLKIAGGFTESNVSFLITENLQIMPNAGLLQVVKLVGDADMDGAEILNYNLGFFEVMDLLKASLISPTPLSDIKPSMNSASTCEKVSNIPLGKSTTDSQAPTPSEYGQYLEELLLIIKKQRLKERNLADEHIRQRKMIKHQHSLLMKQEEMQQHSLQMEKYLKMLEQLCSLSNTQENGNASASNTKKMCLKLIVQRSSNKLLYAEAGDDFVEFLFGLLMIPLGQVESLLNSDSGIKAVDDLYKSVGEFMDVKYFQDGGVKQMVMNPKIPYGYVTKSNIFPSISSSGVTEGNMDPTDPAYTDLSLIFPQGNGNYLVGSQTYKVEDDLTVTPFRVSSVVSSLKKMGIPVSDVEEVKNEIGVEEGLRILKASLTSTSALTDALLLDRVVEKEVKLEPMIEDWVDSF